MSLLFLGFRGLLFLVFWGGLGVAEITALAYIQRMPLLFLGFRGLLFLESWGGLGGAEIIVFRVCLKDVLVVSRV